jgi:retron-type reverse transcriptase
MIEELKPKTQPVSKEQVWTAWKHIRKGGKGMGIDHVSLQEIDSNPRKYLYPLWNRLASGSYFPPPVKEVPIPKGDGKVRMLGIPTILDRVAQQVIRVELEKMVEPLFHPSSFGYRPGKSAHDAVDQCARNCWERWYVVDLDIKGFFDSIDHEQMMSILQK